MGTNGQNPAGETATENQGKKIIVKAAMREDGGGIAVRIGTEIKAVNGDMIEIAVGIGTAALNANGTGTGILCCRGISLLKM